MVMPPRRFPMSSALPPTPRIPKENEHENRANLAAGCCPGRSTQCPEHEPRSAQYLCPVVGDAVFQCHRHGCKRRVEAAASLRRSRDDGQRRSLAWLTSQAAKHRPAQSIRSTACVTWSIEFMSNRDLEIHLLESSIMSKHSSSARRYPRNSPHAAARIVALAHISNGEVEPPEVAVLEAMRAHNQFGLTRQEWHGVVNELCTDLLGSATQGTDCLIDSRMIRYRAVGAGPRRAGTPRATAVRPRLPGGSPRRTADLAGEARPSKRPAHASELLASMVVPQFSRQREFRADAGAATLPGSPQPMIAALRAWAAPSPADCRRMWRWQASTDDPAGQPCFPATRR